MMLLLFLGRELAVKIVDIDHIDHALPSTDSLNMQKVCCYSVCTPCI